MNKLLVTLFLGAMGISSFAQKGQTELSLDGGALSYKKIGNPYFGTFSSGFGFGFCAKHFVTNRTFWATHIYGGTDDGTEYRLVTKDGNRTLTASRQDYALATGIGVNLVSTSRVQSYVQFLGGFGKVEGYTSDYISEKEGVRRFDLNRTSYLLSTGVGIDFSVSKHWKIGGGYSFRYLGGVDGSHSTFAKITYVISPKH